MNPTQELCFKMLLLTLLALYSVPLATCRATGEELAPSSPDIIPVHPAQEVLARSSDNATTAGGSPQANSSNKLTGGKLLKQEAKPTLAGSSKSKSRSKSSPSSILEQQKLNQGPNSASKDASSSLSSSNFKSKFTQRSKKVDRELIESLSPEEFMDSESELMTDFIQEHGNLVSALFGGKYEMGPSNGELEDRVREKLTMRSRRTQAAASSRGAKGTQGVEEPGNGNQKRRKDVDEMLRAIGLYVIQAAANVNSARVQASGVNTQPGSSPATSVTNTKEPSDASLLLA